MAYTNNHTRWLVWPKNEHDLSGLEQVNFINLYTGTGGNFRV